MKKLDSYVSKFNALSSTSVESILEMGSLMLDAKTDLSTNDYDAFLSQVKYTEKSSSIRKWERIGQAKIRLNPLKHMLPPTWSTIYKISGLKPDQLDALVHSGVLTPSVTAKEIDAELKGTKVNIKNECFKIQIVIDDSVDISELNEFIGFIEQHSLRVSMTVKKSESLEAAISTSSHYKLAA